MLCFRMMRNGDTEADASMYCSNIFKLSHTGDKRDGFELNACMWAFHLNLQNERKVRSVNVLLHTWVSAHHAFCFGIRLNGFGISMHFRFE